MLESAEGKIKKVAFELASTQRKLLLLWGTTVTAVTISNPDNSALAGCGVDKVLNVSNEN